MGIFLTTENLECLLSSAQQETLRQYDCFRKKLVLVLLPACVVVRMSIGMDQQKPLSKVNLSRLRRNARSKKEDIWKKKTKAW